jgi:hypothetical protein
MDKSILKSAVEYYSVSLRYNYIHPKMVRSPEDNLLIRCNGINKQHQNLTAVDTIKRTKNFVKPR